MMDPHRAKARLHELVTGGFGSLSHFAIRRPQLVLALAAVVTLASAPGIFRLKLRTDGRALVSPSAPEVVYDRGIREKFGIEDQVVVLIQTKVAEGIFNAATLQLVRELTADLSQMAGINPSNIVSLASEPSFRQRRGSIFHQTLLEPLLETEAQLAQLRQDLQRIQLYNGTIVSAGGKSTVILIGLPSSADRAALYRQVLAIVDRKQRQLIEQASHQPSTDPNPKPASIDGASTPPLEITVTGAPVAESLLGLQLLEDLGVPRSLLGAGTKASDARLEMPRDFHEFRLLLARRIGLVPVAAMVMMAVFLLCFRNVLAMLLPLPGVAATMVFVFGLMGWCGVPVYLTIAVMPVLLTATGLTNDVYLFTRYFTLLRAKPQGSRTELVRETFVSLAAPVASTSLTTAIGFLSFAFSPLTPVRTFGVFTGIGVLFGLIYSLTVVPAMLRLINPALLVTGRSLVPGGWSVVGSGKLAGWFSGFGLTMARRRWWVLTVALGIAALTPLGLRRLVVQDSWIDAFDPEGELRRASRVVNDQFHGMHLLFVSFFLPELRQDKVLPTSITPDGVVLRRDLVEHPALIAGSSIRLSVVKQSPARGPAQPPASPLPDRVAELPATSKDPSSVIVESRVELVYGLGNNISTRIPSRDIPTNFWLAFSNAGQASLEVVVKSHVRPGVIHELAGLADFIRARRQYAVGGVLSPADYLSTTRFMAHPDDPNARHLPDDPAEIKLMWDYYGLARGQQRLHQIVDTNYWQSLTTVFLKDANFVDTAKLMDDIRGYERQVLAPKGIRLGFAGDVALSQSLIHGIVSTQLTSLSWAIVGIFLVTAILGGSLRWGAYCVLPSLLALMIKFAVMGWYGIPLGVATSMFAAMTLGIGVNCAIQLLESYGSPAPNPAARMEALGRAMALTGPPALINTIAVSLGFGVLMLSQMPANARLGLLVVLGLVNCFIASLALLPILLHCWPLKNRRA